MKHIGCLLLSFLFVLTWAAPGRTVDFRARGVWQYSFSAGERTLVRSLGDSRVNADDTFNARQRLRLQLEARASDELSGTVHFEMGPQIWGRGASGGALGADGANVKLRMAFLDWEPPRTRTHLRMGIQHFQLPKCPNLLGGLVADNLDVAGVAAHYGISTALGVTAFWLRPFNDNTVGNALDNMDLFGLTLPLHAAGVEVTPWALYGIRGAAVMEGRDPARIWNDGWPPLTLGANPFGYQMVGATDKAYGSMFWCGLPVGLTALAPWNFEAEFVYGFVEAMGRYDLAVRGGQSMERVGTRREGWIASVLVERRSDWGIPGIYAWYGSGDDDTLRNGSERMPSLSPWAKFSSMIGGDTPFPSGFDDFGSNVAGTWGLGLRVRELRFVDHLRHTLRAVCLGGTNNAGMVKYANQRNAFEAPFVERNMARGFNGYYLTTDDALLEFTADSFFTWGDNLTVGLELGYAVNGINRDLWQAGGRGYLGGSAELRDIWRTTLYVGYAF